MATAATHIANRATAGAAYAAAAQALVDTYIELAAYDMVLANRTVTGQVVPGFGEQPHIPGHGAYLRNIPAFATNIADRIRARHEVLLAS